MHQTRRPLCFLPMHHRFVVPGFLIALALTGCSKESANAVDSAVTDGRGLPEALADDAHVEDVVLAQADGSGTGEDTAAPPEANGISDAGADPGSADAAPGDLPMADGGFLDLRAGDASGAGDLAAAEAPARDGLAREARNVDRPASDGSVADEARPETPAADGPASQDTDDGGCTGWTTLQHLAPAEAKQLIEESDPIVINVHYPYEGDIPGTDATIPFDDVDAIEAYLNYDHCADVLLVCRSGSMSNTAGNALIRRGYLRVRDLEGGFRAWEAAGYPLLKDGGT